MGYILNRRAWKPAKAAEKWLKANPKAWEPWLDGVTTFDGKPGLDAVKAEPQALTARSPAPAAATARARACPRRIDPARSTAPDRDGGGGMYDWLVEHKIPLGRWVKSLRRLAQPARAGVFDFISLVLGAGHRRPDRRSCSRFPPLLLIGSSLRSAPISSTARIGLAVFALPGAAARRQSRLLGGDARDAGAGRLRDAGLRDHRRAARHRRGAPAVALHRASGRSST